MGKPQIVFVHGGDSFANREAFLSYLHTVKPRDPIWTPEPRPKWRETLAHRFVDRSEIFMPTMPNKQNSRYDAWEIWFGLHMPLFRDDIILVGHSLGGVFLTKYLAENTLPVRVRTLALVAAPFEDTDGSGYYSLADFILPENLDNVPRQAGKILLYHSKDDPVVPFTELEKYSRALSGAETSVFEDQGHFLGEDFPELAEHIENILR